MSRASQVVSIALAEVGYKEKASNADLDLATANAGTNNWTKYARDPWQAGYYNGNKNGYAWCDVFVDWCFFKAFGKTEGQLMEYQSGPLGAACPYSAGYYKAQGRFDKTPRVGDQVFFQQGGELVHTGIVVEVTSTQIVTVEGNTSNMVAKRTYSRSSSAIGGYGHPNYDDSSITPAPAPTDPTATVKAWQTWLGVDADGKPGPKTMAAAERRLLLGLLSLRSLRKGDKGDAVQAVQGMLYAVGLDPNGLDGSFGGGMHAAVLEAQRKYKLTKVNGVVGPDTIRALLDDLEK